MNDQVVRTRFAPSPSGRLHIGNLRTALFNLLLARHHQGFFALRVEDSDATRSDATAIEALQSDLRWLGLTWDTGPGINEPENWQQSRRAAAYADAAKRLQAAGAAYPCFCSRERLAALRDRQRRAGEPPRYDGCCAGIAPAEAAQRVVAGEPWVLRLRMPVDGVIEFTDRVRGEQSFPAADLDDPVIQRADGSPAFLFANALDDALMGVTHVLRGEDHLSNTPRQLVLLECLGLEAPDYGHLSLVVDEQDAPLSKRRGASGIDDLRDRGMRPEAICNYLVRLGNPVPDETLQTLDQLAASFDVARMSRRPARFDERQLQHWQSLAMARAPLETLRPALHADCIPDELIPAFIALVQPNLQSADELNDWATRLFDDHDIMTDTARERAIEVGPAFLETAMTLIESADTGDWKSLRARLEEATGRRGGALMKPLRQVLTGLDYGPALGAIIHIMPATIRRLRFQRAAAVASGAGPDA